MNPPKTKGIVTFYSQDNNYLDGTVNLKCPLAINPDTRKGIQVILSNADYDYRHTLRSLLGKEIKEQDTKKGDK